MSQPAPDAAVSDSAPTPTSPSPKWQPFRQFLAERNLKPHQGTRLVDDGHISTFFLPGMRSPFITLEEAERFDAAAVAGEFNDQRGGLHEGNFGSRKRKTETAPRKRRAAR